MHMMFRIVPMSRFDVAEAAALALLLWPNHSADELRDAFEALANAEDAAVFLAYSEERAVGFAQCGLRRDYVEGTSGSPVGYLEGIFVREECRGQGAASALLEECRAWSRRMGCSEFASDCELTNTASLQFHLRSGFSEANRIICFVQKL